MHTRLSFVAVLGLVCACEKAQTDPPKSEAKSEAKAEQAEAGDDAGEPKPPTDPNSCMPPGLETASKIEALPLPRGCQVVAPGDLLAPTIVRGLDELARAIECEPHVESLNVDFGKYQLHVATFMLSPAYAGSELFDDGKRITFVQRDRSPCPGDPQPMPIGSSIVYQLPLGAERTYAQTSCSLPPQCD